MAATGLRIGECLGVLTDDVDLAKRTVSVHGTVVSVSSLGAVIKREPKSPTGNRTLTLPTWAMPTVEGCVSRAVKVTVTVFREPDSSVTYLLFSQANTPAVPSAANGSTVGSTASACTRPKPVALLCSSSPPNYPPPSWPGCSASTSPAPPHGNAPAAETGRPTPPT
jgi:hypothetical protein